MNAITRVAPGQGDDITLAHEASTHVADLLIYHADEDDAADAAELAVKVAAYAFTLHAEMCGRNRFYASATHAKAHERERAIYAELAERLGGVS